MKADLVAREPQRLQQWETGALYQRIQQARTGAEKFILHDGPPFANGDVHIGTALNKILKDIIIKYHTILGRHAPYVPGWDCHGLPIEFKVSQEMRKAGNTAADPATIRTACDAYARKYIDLQRTQFRRLGILGEWDNPYLTLNKEYEADELRMFADIVQQGFVYRGKKPVYWSIPARTALAEAEVEYHDHTSHSIYVKFPVVGMPATFVLIWTTTPWTLPANLGVAYNSTFMYSHVRVGKESYILSNLLLPTIAEKCGWSDYDIVRSLDGDHLSQLQYQHPFCERTGRLYAGDNFVESSTGTGFVHIAPGHGLEDYGLGLQHKLPVYSPVDDDGRFSYTADLPRTEQMPESLIGKSILEKHGDGKSEANEAVVALLSENGSLLFREDYLHSYPFCWRSKTPVIYRAMDQWFINIDHQGFREKALKTIDGVDWVPAWGKNRIESAVKARPDWCISRQRTWGVPIPAFYDASGHAILTAEIIKRTADLVEKHGSNVWFQRTAAELWQELRPAHWTGPEAVAKGADTLDVWIDSGSSSRAVIMRREELKVSHSWPADMYLEGSDQHRGWFQSSLLLSLAGNGAAPYKTVLTHGFMVDADRQKVSKSREYQKPQTSEVYVKSHGADVIRLWVASQDFRNDIVISDKRIQTVSETYRVIRNALRYQLSNLYDFDPGKHRVAHDQLTALDRWMLEKLGEVENAVATAYAAYEFHGVYQAISQFAAVELSAIYHDVVKDRLYTDAAGSKRRRSTQTVLYHLVSSLCKMLSPILVFTADEAWEFLAVKETDSVHLALWKGTDFSRPTEERETWNALLKLREPVLLELEKARQTKLIGKALEAKVTLAGSARELAAVHAQRETFRELLNVSQLEVAPAESPLQIQVQKADGQKCERCWHWEFDVGKHPGHATICGRCVQAVNNS